MRQRIKLAILLCSLGAALLIGKAFAFPTITLVEPETVNPDTKFSPPPPLLMPPDEADYTKQDPVKAARMAGRAIAHLPTAPAGTNTTELRLLPESPLESRDSVEYAVKSVVRYSGNGTTIVSLAVPSPSARLNPTVYGEKTVTLPSGERAFIQSDRPGALPRSLTIMRRQHIITIATDRPESELIEFAKEVQIATP